MISSSNQMIYLRLMYTTNVNVPNLEFQIANEIILEKKHV